MADELATWITSHMGLVNPDGPGYVHSKRMAELDVIEPIAASISSDGSVLTQVAELPYWSRAQQVTKVPTLTLALIKQPSS